MREVAERRQQLELEHEQALAILKFKQDEIKRLQRSKVRDLEEKCRGQSEQFGLLSQELEKFRMQASKVDLAASTLPNNPSLSVLTNGLGLTADRASEVEELDIDVAPAPYSVNRGASKLQVFIARYSYNPYDGPNDNPEVELPLTAGEYIYVYGDMDEDGFYEGELMDGRRGLVPSNFVDGSQRTESSAAPDLDFEEVGVDIVPYPRKLTLIKQLAKSIIIGWDPPSVPAGWGNVLSYSVYVDQELRLSVPFGSQNKAVLERLDITLKTYRVSVQSLTEKGPSDQLRCSMLVGRDVSVAPTQLNIDRVTATTANLSWLPCNSNYVHIVSLNGEEYELVKAGCYSLCLTNLCPSLQYTVKVEARPHRTPWELPVERREHRVSTVTFKTLMAGPPDAPLDVQLEQGPSPGIALISWLPVTIDAAGTSNGVRVTGYSIYADKRKVLEVSSPTAGSVLLGPSQIQSLQGARELTVRSMSAHGESCDSLPVNVPFKLDALLTGPSITPPVVPPPPCVPVSPCSLPSPDLCICSPLLLHAYVFQTYGKGLVEPLSDYHADNSRSDLSDILEEEEEDLSSDHLGETQTMGYIAAANRLKVHLCYVNTLSLLYLFKSHNMSMGLLPLCECVCVSEGCIESPKGKGGCNIRLFVALFSYDPASMSPNPGAIEEELPFIEGQIIQVFGDKDADGFYHGECAGRVGLVPCNMVSEIQVEDEETRQHLLKQGTLSTVSSTRKMVAIFDYDPRESSPNTDIEAELTFSAGDIIHVMGDMDEDGFFYGDLNGQRGLVPSNFLQPLLESNTASLHPPDPTQAKKKKSFFSKGKRLFKKLSSSKKE
uniref:RIMS-binding protein 2 n=1 Tax=Periophthalmus magnuspinnatus TaxID=409849 RepID=A0A3B4AHH0_9GOBI